MSQVQKDPMILPRLLMSTKELAEWLWSKQNEASGDVMLSLLASSAASAVVANGGSFTLFEPHIEPMVGIEYLTEALKAMLDYIHDNGWEDHVEGEFGNGIGLHARTLLSAGGMLDWYDLESRT